MIKSTDTLTYRTNYTILFPNLSDFSILVKTKVRTENVPNFDTE